MRLIDASELLEHLEACLQNGRPLSNLYDLSEIVRYVKSMPSIASSPWHRVEEPPKEGTWCVIAKHSYLQPHNLFYDIAHYLHGTFSVYDSGVGDWFDGKPLYWMPIEPPKEDA